MSEPKEKAKPVDTSSIEEDVSKFFNVLVETDYLDGDDYVLNKDFLQSLLDQYLPNRDITIQTKGRTRETVRAYISDKELVFIIRIDGLTYEMTLGEQSSIAPVKNRVWL